MPISILQGSLGQSICVSIDGCGPDDDRGEPYCMSGMFWVFYSWIFHFTLYFDGMVWPHSPQDGLIMSMDWPFESSRLISFCFRVTCNEGKSAHLHQVATAVQACMHGYRQQSLFPRLPCSPHPLPPTFCLWSSNHLISCYISSHLRPRQTSSFQLSKLVSTAHSAFCLEIFHCTKVD